MPVHPTLRLSEAARVQNAINRRRHRRSYWSQKSSHALRLRSVLLVRWFWSWRLPLLRSGGNWLKAVDVHQQWQWYFKQKRGTNLTTNVPAFCKCRRFADPPAAAEHFESIQAFWKSRLKTLCNLRCFSADVWRDYVGRQALKVSSKQQSISPTALSHALEEGEGGMCVFQVMLLRKLFLRARHRFLPGAWQRVLEENIFAAHRFKACRWGERHTKIFLRRHFCDVASESPNNKMH